LPAVNVNNFCHRESVALMWVQVT